MAFTLGNQTLVANVFSTPAATVTRLHSDGSTSSERFIEYKFNPAQITDPEEYSVKFSTALDTVFERLLSDSGYKQLVVPLSGGLDSRLIAIWLRKFDAPNVRCFTYGKTGSRESGISKQVADDLGMPWLYVAMDTNEVRRAWHEPSTDSFLRATWKGTSLPHVQDWYALHEMKAKRLVAEDAIFLPGHTIVGSMHDEELVQRAPSNREIIDALLKCHANTQGKWRTASKLPTILDAIAEVMAQYKDGGSRRVQEIIEWFSLSQRQAKYINNSMASAAPPHELRGSNRCSSYRTTH